MPSKSPKKLKARKSTALGRKLSRLGKRYWSEVHQIARRREIPLQEARKAWKETFIESVREAGARPLRKKFVAVGQTPTGKWQYRVATPEAFRKIAEVGYKPELFKPYLKGPRLSLRHVERSIRTSVYWGLVDRTAVYWHLSRTDARQLLKLAKEEMKRVGRAQTGRGMVRIRDAAAMLEYSDRYPKLRNLFVQVLGEFGRQPQRERRVPKKGFDMYGDEIFGDEDEAGEGYE